MKTLLNTKLTSCTVYTNTNETSIPKIKFVQSATKAITVQAQAIEQLTRKTLPFPVCVRKDNSDHFKGRIAAMNSVNGTNKRFYSYVGEHTANVTKNDPALGEFSTSETRHIVADLVITEERVVVFVIEYVAGQKFPNKNTIVFCNHSVVASGDKFTAKKLTITDFNDVVIEKRIDAPVEFSAIEKAAKVNPYGDEAEAILKLAKQVMRAREIAQAKEVIDGEDHGTDAFAEEVVAFARNEVVPTVATETDDQVAFVEVEVEEVAVAAKVLTTEIKVAEKVAPVKPVSKPATGWGSLLKGRTVERHNWDDWNDDKATTATRTDRYGCEYTVDRSYNLQ